MAGLAAVGFTYQDQLDKGKNYSDAAVNTVAQTGTGTAISIFGGIVGTPLGPWGSAGGAIGLPALADRLGATEAVGDAFENSLRKDDRYKCIVCAIP